ncbi:MAG: bifunctional riboflavin kinase/FMN adenylyltransferase, partial [bacterium]
MRIITELENIRWDGPTVLTLGKFDGLHRGHQALICRVLEKAKELGTSPLVLSLGISRESLFSKEEKRKILANWGVAGHIECPFVPAIITMEATDFVREILVGRLHVRHIVAGPDFRFGYQRRGDVELLKRMGRELGGSSKEVGSAGEDRKTNPGVKVSEVTCTGDETYGDSASKDGNEQRILVTNESEREADNSCKLDGIGNYGFTVDVIPKLREDGEIISSRSVRSLLAEGRMQEVEKLLGFPYFVSGEILHGRRIGRTIGFPTTNLITPPEKLLPPNGVYFVRSEVNGQEHFGITNIGTKPTVDGSFVGVETHLFELHEEIYGERQKVELLHFARPEKRFAGLDELRDQISRDMAA